MKAGLAVGHEQCMHDILAPSACASTAAQKARHRSASLQHCPHGRVRVSAGLESTPRCVVLLCGAVCGPSQPFIQPREVSDFTRATTGCARTRTERHSAIYVTCGRFTFEHLTNWSGQGGPNVNNNEAWVSVSGDLDHFMLVSRIEPQRSYLNNCINANLRIQGQATKSTPPGRSTPLMNNVGVITTTQALWAHVFVGL